MGELEDLQVYGESHVGWCEATAPNEYVDKDGARYEVRPAHIDPDPRAPARRAYDDPEVGALRRRLAEANGIRGLATAGASTSPRAAAFPIATAKAPPRPRASCCTSRSGPR